MSKLKRTKSQGLFIEGLFTKQELNKLEELRKKEYTKHEVGNPQFQNADYESYRISIFQKDSPFSNIGSRALNALVGYDYSVAEVAGSSLVSPISCRISINQIVSRFVSKLYALICILFSF